MEANEDVKECEDCKNGTQGNQSKLNGVLCAAIELLAVAEMRGDDELPHPADDQKLWTARMQDAWSDLREQVEAISPDAIHEEVVSSQKLST